MTGAANSSYLLAGPSGWPYIFRGKSDWAYRRGAISRGCSKAAQGAALLLERIARDVYVERGAQAINPTQWAAMRYFKRAGEESRTPLHLAKFLGVTPAPASRTIASLERRGYATRRPNPNDRRSVLIDLTDLGLRVLGEDPIDRLAVVIDCLQTAERSVLEASLVNIADRLADVMKDGMHGRDSGG
jgi:DNA-binding MarR family transcriptional regulator